MRREWLFDFLKLDPVNIILNKSIEVSSEAAVLHSKFLAIQDSTPGLLVLEQNERLVIFSEGKFIQGKRYCSREGKVWVGENELRGPEEEKYFNETITLVFVALSIAAAQT